MRLLERQSDGGFRFTDNLLDKDIPQYPYTILSHTWGQASEEVTFEDMMEGSGRCKAGYKKIKFCGEQAARDGFTYFWVDSCCIKKSSDAELSESINSMFRWYQRAEKCYVYLSDVSTRERKRGDQNSQNTWEAAFRGSRWFTRGWTLQELLAPVSVEFFSREGKLLGDKRSLEQQIYEVTGISITALRGTPLSQFDVDDRLLWAENRQTTREEDKAYSLLGIFNVYIPLIYGEGRDHALIRLREAIEKPLKEQKIVLDRLRSADSAAFDSHDEEHNARCYQGTRVELLRQIDTWASDRGSECIFWLNGMAGTGKSTISRTVAQNFADKGDLGASFFFKRGEGDRGHAGLFITTIATQLVRKLPSLAPHVQNAIDNDPVITTKALKHQFNTLVLQPLGKIHTDPQQSSRIMVVIDALDECDREEDARIIILLLSQVKRITSVQLKFFLTSRPELPIRLGFEDISGRYKGLVLHQIPEPVVKEDISTFLEHELAMIRDSYNKSVKSNRQLPADWPGQTNVQILVEMAIPLFIFAATVCRFINDRRCGQPNERLTKVLEYQTKSQASKLDATYLPVLNQLLVGVTDVEKRRIIEEFQQIVGSIAILASPLSATSLDRLFGVPEGTVDSKTDLLHSVLSIPSCPDHPIRLLHLSFRDFLVDTEKRETNPFWVEEKQAHQRITNSCIRLMSTSLKQDICGLNTPGVLVSDVESSRVERSLTPEVQYACLYWIQHFHKSGAQLRDDDQVHQFLQEHLLHWLEALGWMQKVSEGIYAIASLESITAVCECPRLSEFVYDTKRFVLYNRPAIEQAPLQTYCGALVFAPAMSIVRKLFKDCVPEWMRRLPEVESNWNALLQTLEGHSDWVTAVAFSPDGKLLASASQDMTVKLWDTGSGATLQILEGHSNSVTAVAFSPDGKLLASASDDETVKLWDACSGAALQTLEGHSSYVNAVAFSPDGKLLASASHDKTVKLWDTGSGAAFQTLEGHSLWVNAIAFSPDGKLLASASRDETVKLWDACSGAALQTLEGHSSYVNAVAFSPDGKLLASASDGWTVRLWDAGSGAALQTLEGHSSYVNAVAFSPDGKLLASASDGWTVRLWDAGSGAALQTLEGHWGPINAVAFSPDGKLLASASHDKRVELWDAGLGTALHTFKSHSDSVTAVAFSPDSKLLASASWDKTVKLWSANLRITLQTLKGHSSYVTAVAFSPDGKQLASASHDKTVKLWDADSGAALHTLEGHSDWVKAVVAFSPDGKLLALASDDMRVTLWDTDSGAALQTLKGHSGLVTAVAFSLDGKLIASASQDKTVKLWDTGSGAALQILEGHSNSVTAVAFSLDGKLLVSASDDKRVKLWDTGSGAALQTLEGHSSPVTAVAFSLDSKLLASASYGKTVKLWDACTGAALQTLEGHSSYVNAVAFSPDGKLLASASDDETVKLWDAGSGAALRTLELETIVNSLLFSNDRTFVQTNRGPFPTGFLSDSAAVFPSNLTDSIFVKEQWVNLGMKNLLWLPSDHRPRCVTVRGSIVAFGYDSGQVSFMEFAF